MRATRTIIGLLIIIFLALPILVGVIWTVGVTKAAVSPELISDLPREIIDEFPRYLDDIIREAQDPSVIRDADTRAWFTAISRASMKPTDVLERSGISGWMEGELSRSLAKIGETLRGQRDPDPIFLNLRPLKEALHSGEIERYVEDVLHQLPACDEEGLNAWMVLADRSSWEFEDLPPCLPDMDLALSVMRVELTADVDDVPDEVEFFEGVDFVPFGFSKVVVWLSYLLFLIPAGFLILGSLVGSSSAGSFCRWFGVSTFIGGLIPLGMSLFVGGITHWAIRWAPHMKTEEWSSDLGLLILGKIDWIPMMIVDKIFSPVAVVSGVVCIVGVFFFAVSFLMGRNK
ncbi:MAG: hypothetical protein KKC69_01370 [Acidobacteria bacterium]|nr:hypothetical protein [Acidobacteriota bacterium]